MPQAQSNIKDNAEDLSSIQELLASRDEVYQYSVPGRSFFSAGWFLFSFFMLT